jgi:hypothetical protein
MPAKRQSRKRGRECWIGLYVIRIHRPERPVCLRIHGILRRHRNSLLSLVASQFSIQSSDESVRYPQHCCDLCLAAADELIKNITPFGLLSSCFQRALAYFCIIMAFKLRALWLSEGCIHRIKSISVQRHDLVVKLPETCLFSTKSRAPICITRLVLKVLVARFEIL